MTDHAPRLHALDALRGTMMLLGILLHSAISFTVTPIGAPWPYKATQTSALNDLLVFIIHLFRMPTFFVVAGLFAAMLYSRRGITDTLRNRSVRIAMPLLVGWLVLTPLVKSGFILGTTGGDWSAVAAIFASVGSMYLDQFSSMHLWFLYVLMLFYLGAGAVLPLLRRIPLTFRERWVGGVATVTRARWGPLALGAGMTALLIPMRTPGLDTPTELIPFFPALFAYAVFFAYGWSLLSRRTALDALGARSWWYLITGLALAVVYAGYVSNPVNSSAQYFHVIAITLAGLPTVLLILGSIGLFIRYCAAPSARFRYLSDASYWIYLVHLPFTIWIPVLLSTVAWPAAVKVLVTITVTTALAITTYHLFVRSTVIGEWLNGRRYPRKLPDAVEVLEGQGRAAKTQVSIGT